MVASATAFASGALPARCASVLRIASRNCSEFVVDIGSSPEIKLVLLYLSSNFPSRGGIRVKIDIGITRLDKLHQIIKRSPHEVAQQVLSRNCPLRQVPA